MDFEQKKWWVYVIISSVNTTYVGSTTDPLRRLRQHNGDICGGAKSTRSNRPWKLGRVYGPYESRSAAFRAEITLKRSKRSKNRLIWNPKDSEHFRDSEEAAKFTEVISDACYTLFLGSKISR